MAPWVFEVPSYFGQTVSFEFPRTQCDVNVEIPQWNPKARSSVNDDPSLFSNNLLPVFNNNIKYVQFY